ncbi:MAG: CFI-box-CTERM domain-containing protein [Myxococcales bacterium]|nr:fibronectin type III domain-containing protein [Myxococcota bacterium]MDW8281023.1 CFI-box-CTERM domain-containing protein [Myxococcales bacterium]
MWLPFRSGCSIAMMLALVASLGHWLPARAERACRVVEVRFLPHGVPSAGPGTREPLSPQIAVWVEDRDGRYVDTLFVTRVTGLLGLGNRTGAATLKSDFRWPYGKRPMVLPVWAHKRGKRYPLVVMGGACSPRCGGDAHNSGADPDDEDTVAYHGSISSAEPYYCSPSGWRTRTIDGVDVISCASAFYSSKGRFLEGHFSFYPPRADIDPSQVSPQLDHPDLKRFAALNDLVAVSGATPPTDRILDPPIRWAVPNSLPDGEYLLRVEVNREADWNPPWWTEGRSKPDKYPAWDIGFGKQYLGQPSVVYTVPFRLGAAGHTFRTRDYEGYGDINGTSGRLFPPDMTIRTDGGSGGDRLRLVRDPEGDWRVHVTVVPCGEGGCIPPPPPSGIELENKTDTTMTVAIQMPPVAEAQNATIQVRYREGLPITEESFNHALPAPMPPTARPGQRVTTDIRGLQPRTTYHVAARAVSACGAASALVTASTDTETGHYTTLQGCFVATAAYGSPLATQVGVLRVLRDRYLLPHPLGQLLVATYYAMSPPLAALVGGPGREPLRRAVRTLLHPLVSLARALSPSPAAP